jgi:signal transduction histidine kinase
MFKRISYNIALRFTAFVCLLMLVNGSLFLLADYSNSRRMGKERLIRSLNPIIHNAEGVFSGQPVVLPLQMRERIRILQPDGHALFSGNLFSDLPAMIEGEVVPVRIQDEEYMIVSRPVIRDGKTIGYVQVAGMEPLRRSDLPLRALIFLIVTLAISALTFAVGLLFARSSLKPAERMMERLERFTQDASHEIRTPLAAVRSSLDLALQTGKFEEGIRSAKQDIDGIASLTERLLELTRLDALGLRLEHVDLSALLHTTVEKYRPMAKEKNITLNASIADDIRVQADAMLLQQVVGNLIANALKFSKPEGGTISITLKKGSLSIADTGIGIAKEQLDRVFDRFYQADPCRSQGGFGLGLSLVKRIVELHGWSIAAQSTQGKGATFTVLFSAAK